MQEIAQGDIMEVVNVNTLIKLLEYLGCNFDSELVESFYDEYEGYVETDLYKIKFPNGYVLEYDQRDDDEIETFLYAVKQCEEVMGKNIVNRTSTDKTIGVKIDWYPTD